MKNLKIQLHQENLNYYVIINEAGQKLKNEKNKVHLFSYPAAIDTVRALNENVPAFTAMFHF